MHFGKNLDSIAALIGNLFNFQKTSIKKSIQAPKPSEACNSLFHVFIGLHWYGNSLKAIEEALIITKQRKSELVMIAVAETFQDTELTDIGIEGGREALMPLVEKSLEKARDIAVREGIKPKVVLKKGISPDTGILKCAEEEKVDLIVMGHRKRTGLDLFILGSITSKVVNNAHCSVFVVR